MGAFYISIGLMFSVFISSSIGAMNWVPAFAGMINGGIVIKT
jgi:hypothetical protein